MKGLDRLPLVLARLSGRLFGYMVALSLTIAPGLTARSQSDSLYEISCDTIIDGFDYKLCLHDSLGTLRGWGNRNAKGLKHGYWHLLKPSGQFSSEGEYRQDIRVGTWWVSQGEYIKYNRRGRVRYSGCGCRHCTPF
jgi:hypothetical protein